MTKRFYYKPRRTLRKAPKGKFRVVGVFIVDGNDTFLEDYDTFEEAKRVADSQCDNLTRMHVYDDQRKHLYEVGGPCSGL